MLDALKPLRRSGTARTWSEATRRRIVATKIRIAISAMPHSAVAGFAGVAIGLLGMSHVGPGWAFELDRPLILWALVTSFAISLGIGPAFRFNRTKGTDEEAFREGRFHALVFGCTGACWGSASWVLLPARTVEQDAFLLAGMAMVMMGAAGAQAVYRPLVLGFTVALTTLFVTGLLRLGDAFHLTLALGFAIYSAVVLVYARKQEVAVTTSIELALENEELLHERTAQQRAAEQARRLAEEAREQAEQARELAEKADRSKTNFIAATSHDLRQPMHALVQYVEHLRRTCCDPGSVPTIDRIEDSVAAMENLLNAVLDFSKISMGAIKPSIEAFPVDRLLRSIDTQVRPLAQGKGLELRVESTDAHFESDPVLLERVIRNVAQNAVRYTMDGSIVIRAVPRGDRVRVLVSDSGIGVHASEKERIFDEYYQVDNRARDRRKGLGLGLAIVRDLARLLDLRVRLKSIPGRGSTFAIDVPRVLSVVRSEEPLPADEAVDMVRGAFVVLIDDDPLARDALGLTLKDLGCRVLTAASGIEALDELGQAEFAPQIVVSDYRLAGNESGLEAIAMVVENQRALYGESFPLPALLVSGDTSPEELDRVAQAGYPMLHKPVSRARLFEALNAALQAVVDAQRA